MNTEQLRIQLNKAAEKAATAIDIVEAIKTLPADGSNQIADYIAEFCRERNIDPQAPELVDFYKQTTEYKTALETEQKAANLNRAVEATELFTKTFRENESRGAVPSPQQITEDTGHINKLLAGIGEAANKNPFITFENYLDERVNKKYWAEFSPALFGGHLPFPDGTLSAIGAAPGSGKSAALVNLCRELLTTTPTNNPNPSEAELKQNINAHRNILFLSAEMTVPDILDRLVHCLAWQKGQYNPQYELDKVSHTNIDYWRVLKAITGKDTDLLFTKQEKRRGELYRDILETYIRPAWGNRLKIAYVRGYQTFDEITNIIINNATPGSLILMDYLQLFPPTAKDSNIDGSNGNSSSPRYLQIRHTIDAAILTAEKTQSVIVAAAQLGRETRKEGTAQGVDDTQGWRESGDIEQSGWNLIKMFLETNEEEPTQQQLSYRISKCRSAAALGQGYILTWIPGYQYMERTEDKKTPPPWAKKRQSTDKKDKVSKEKKKYPPKPDNWTGTDEEYEKLIDSRGGWQL